MAKYLILRDPNYKYLGFGYKGLVFCALYQNGCWKIGRKYPSQMPHNLSAWIVCSSPNIWDFDEKRLHWASVVRDLKRKLSRYVCTYSHKHQSTMFWCVKEGMHYKLKCVHYKKQALKLFNFTLYQWHSTVLSLYNVKKPNSHQTFIDFIFFKLNIVVFFTKKWTQ